MFEPLCESPVYLLLENVRKNYYNCENVEKIVTVGLRTGLSGLKKYKKQFISLVLKKYLRFSCWLICKLGCSEKFTQFYENPPLFVVSSNV